MKQIPPLLLISLFFVIASCQEEDTVSDLAASTDGSKQASEATLYTRINGHPVPLVKRGDYYVADGDIIVDLDSEGITGSSESSRTAGVGVTPESLLWPNGVIPYEFSSTMSENERTWVKQIMDNIEYYTKVRFREANNDSDYIVISDGGAAGESKIGRQGGGQIVRVPTMGERPVLGALHELFHVIGLNHEQTRLDRDEHLIVDSSVLLNSDYFKSSSRTYEDYYEFDFNSIMLYSSFKDGRVVMRKKNGDTFGGYQSQSWFSWNDVYTVRAMYP